MSEIKPNDLAVIQVPTLSPVDIRSPRAEDFETDKRITVNIDNRFNSGFEALEFEFTGDRRLWIKNGKFISAIAREPIMVDANIEIPALPDTESVVDREDRIYFINFVAEIGTEIDSDLNVTIQYRNLDEQGRPTGEIITTSPKENTRRHRYYWGFIHATANITPETFWQGLEQGEYTTTIDQDGELINQTIPYDDTIYRFLPVTTLGDIGFGLSNNYWFYAKDPNLVNEAAYKIINKRFELIEICRIIRKQNVTQEGYSYGAELPFELDYNLKRKTKKKYEPDTESYQRIIELMSGKPGINGVYQKTVKNLIAGQITGGEQPGEITASPNGSVALANDQRSNFSNQRRVEAFTIQRLTAQNTGDNSPLLTAILNTNAPAGTLFSDNTNDHKIYDNDGLEQSVFGRFISQVSSISWEGGANSTISPGDTAYFQAGVRYAAGSGFIEPFQSIEKVWNNGSPLDNGNVRFGLDDLAAYEAPLNGEEFIVIHGRERGAIHRIYKHLVVTSDANGIARIPNSEPGVFAFLDGVSGRLNRPVVTGLTPNTDYNALIYYIPKSSGDTWQFQLKFLPYQGVGSAHLSLLSGAKIISEPLFFVHSLGGGCSCYQGEGTFQYQRISSHLPAVAGGVKDYNLNNPIHLFGEDYLGPITFQQMNLLPAQGLVLPKKGMMINYSVRSPLGHPRSLNIALENEGQVLGFKSPSFADPNYIYQYVLGFLIENNEMRKLLIATHNNIGNLDIHLDSDKLTAIDLFDI